MISDIEKEFLDFKRNFYGQFPSKICKNSKTLTGAGIPAGQKFSTGTGPAVYRYRFHLWSHFFLLNSWSDRTANFFTCTSVKSGVHCLFFFEIWFLKNLTDFRKLVAPEKKVYDSIFSILLLLTYVFSNLVFKGKKIYPV
jgi:hypothetical protein